MHRREFLRKFILGASLLAAPSVLTRAWACKEWSSTDPDALLSMTNLTITGTAGDTFAGSSYRVAREQPPYLRFEVDATAGTVDAAIRGNYTLANVADISFLNSSYYVEASYGLHEATQGTAEWWCGPKVSVNINGLGGSPGAFEGYIIEKSNRDQATFGTVLLATGGVAIGTTQQDGATYNHYRVNATSPARTQFWAIRQTYRTGGPVLLPPMIIHWLSNGMPQGLQLDQIKLNVEHTGAGRRIFEIKDVHIPTSYA